MKHICPDCKIIWYCSSSNCPNIKCENCAITSDEEFKAFPICDK